MDYKVLTTENQRDLLKKRLLDYEMQHFQHEIELELAKVQGLDDIQAEVQTIVENFEKLVTWCHSKLAELEDKL